MLPHRLLPDLNFKGDVTYLYSDWLESDEIFPLPSVFLERYPDLEKLQYRQSREIALAIYYHNRMIQNALDTLSQGREIRGLSDGYVASILELIEASLTRLRAARERPLLMMFIAQETAMLNDSRRGVVRRTE